MPNIISKILHRKSRSGSSSPSSPTSPSSTGLVASRDRAGASTIRLDDRFDADGSPISPGSPESRRKSMSAARSNPTSPTAPARKSLDARPNGIYVNPARPAPPPPVPEARSHRPNGTTDVDGTVVIDGRADPRYAGRVESETTAGLYPSPPMHELDRTSEANGGQFDRRGLFDDTPAASVALDHQHFSSSPASPPIHDSPATREAVVRPGPVSLDLDRELPPLPRNPSHEIKQVDSRRRPTMSETGQRQSVEAELGREPSSDMVDGERERERERERGSRLSDGRGMERSIDEEGSHLSVVNGKERASLDIPERGSSSRNAELGASENNGSIRSGAGRAGHGVGAVPYSTPTTGSVERQMAGLAIRDDPKRALLAGGKVPLGAQRLGLVRSVVDESEKRRLQRGALSEQGLRTFEAAGMSHLVGKASTVDVTTQWLKPVVHETIINRIHTEYLTIINREIHKHHIYPKIQPIEDPNPIVLPPLHRIFSPATGKWHEVQGDDAAIAILGEDVFRNGPKEVRHVRKPVTDDVLRAESEGATIPPVGPDGKGLSTVAPATQLGGARVVEREGILGGEMGEWKKTDHAHLFGRLKEEIGKAL